jgi:hypothetical protein
MKNRILSFAVVSLCSLSAAHAAIVTWTTSPGVADTEISNVGTQVFGYYFNADVLLPSAVNVNAVPFVLWSNSFAPPELNFNGSYSNVESTDQYQVPPNGNNTGLNQILDGQNWGSEAPLTVTGLIPGRAYELQYMISDDRADKLNRRNYAVSDSNDPPGSRDIEYAYISTRGGGVPPTAPPGSVDAKIFTGRFTADATGTQDIYNVLYEGTDHTGTNAGSQVDALQVRLVPEPAAAALAAIGFGLFGLFGLRRRRI